MISILLLFFLLGSHLQHKEIPRLGVQLELQLPAYTTTTTTPDPSCICDLHHSSRQHWILNPLSKARDRTHVLMDPSQVHYCWVTTGTPRMWLLMWVKWRVKSCFQYGSNMVSHKYLWDHSTGKEQTKQFSQRYLMMVNHLNCYPFSA